MKDSNRDSYLGILEDMIKIYSPSGGEGRLARYLRDRLKELGFKDFRIDDVGNLSGQAGCGLPRVLFIGHIDTVAGNLPFKISGDKIFGRGAVDAKSSMAAMIAAASKWVRDEEEGTVNLHCLVGEERLGVGIRHLLEKPLEAEYAIFGEPGGARNVTIGYKGHIGASLSVYTEPEHSSSQLKESNAIEMAWELWSGIRKDFMKFQDSGGSLFKSITSNITKIKGGKTENKTPESCHIYLDIRVPPKMRCRDVEEILRRKVEDYNVERKGKASLDLKFKVEPVVIKKASPVVRAITRSILMVIGRPVGYIKKIGTGDMNVFAQKTDIPVATYGPGDPRLSHTSKENIDIKEYLTSIKIYHNTVKELKRLYTKGLRK